MAINTEDWEIVEDDGGPGFEQSAYPRLAPSPELAYSPLPEGWQAPADQRSPFQIENEMRADYGAPGTELTQAIGSAVADIAGIDRRSPEQKAEDARIAEFQQQAGVEEIPTSLKMATALSSGFTKAANLPQKVGETLNDITGFSRVMDTLGVPGPEMGWQSNTEAALRQIAEQERRMAIADEAVTGGGAGYQILEGTARGLAELPAQLLPGMAARNTAQAIRIAAGTAGALGGSQQFAQSRGEGQSTLEALPRAALSGIITAMTTRAFGATGAESLLRAAGPVGFKERLKDIIKQAGWEAAEESVDQMGQDILERHAQNPSKPMADTIREVLIAGAVGGLVGGIATGSRSAIPSRSTEPSVPRSEIRPTTPSDAGPNKAATQAATEQFNADSDAEEMFQLQEARKSGKLSVEDARRLESLESNQQGLGQLSPEDRQYLEAERAAIDEDVEVVGDISEDSPFSGQVATIDRRTGKILINPREFSLQMQQVPPAQRAAYVKSLLAEESIHLKTDDKSAESYWNALTAAEKAIAKRRYTGSWRGKTVTGVKVSDKNFGHEAMRFRLQQMAGMTPTEIAATAGREKWTLQTITAMERGISAARSAIGTKASVEQRAILDRMSENLKIAKAAIEGGASGDEPAALRIPGNASAAINDFAQKFMRGPEEGFKMTNADTQKAGLEMKGVADLDALLSMRRSAVEERNKLKAEAHRLIAAGDRDAGMKAMNRMAAVGPKTQYIREAIEMATNLGSWQEGPRNKFGPRPLDAASNPEVRKWLEQHGEEVGVRISDEAPAAVRRVSTKMFQDFQKAINSAGNEAEAEKIFYDFQDKLVAEINKAQREWYKESGEELPLGEEYSADNKFVMDLFVLARKELKQRWGDGQQAFPAAIRRGGPSKRGQEIAEQKRRIAEMQAKARGEELPPELQTKAAPVEPAIPREERVSAEQAGALPRIGANDLEARASSVLQGEINIPQEKRPTFDEFATWARRNMEGVQPHQLRDMWEDRVWGALLRAEPQRLESWRKVLGLESKYGARPIVPIAPPEGFALETQGDKILARQDKLAAEAKQRYRNKIVGAIARRLIGESIEGRASLNRTSVGIDDIAFDNEKTVAGPYAEINRDDIADPKRLNAILRDQARGSSSDPESASRRLVAVVGSDGRVHLLTTYNDAGVQRVTDPGGTSLRNKPSRELNRTFLNQYRPFASILLTDPVKGLRQTFASVTEFNDKIGKEASERARIGDWEIVPEGPAPDDFKAEGTPGLEGEGGSFMGPAKQTVVSGARPGAMESDVPLTEPEIDSVLNHIMDETGGFSTPDDVRLSLAGLIASVENRRLTSTDRMVINGYRKVFDAIEATNPNLSREEILDRMADQIYANYQSSETASEFVKKSMAQFAPQSARPAGPQPQEGGAIGEMAGGRAQYEYIPKGSLETQPPAVEETDEERAARERFVAERSAALVGDRPLPEMSAREAAQRANVEASVAGGPQLAEAARRRGIQIERERALRKQGVLPTYEQAQQIYDQNFPEQGEMPASVRRYGQEDDSSNRSRLQAMLAKIYARKADEERGQEILDTMEDEEISPADSVRKFWNETFPVLPKEVQSRFTRMTQAVTGLNVGEVIGTNADGSEIVANSAADLYTPEVAPAEVRHLEGEERGLVALMETANRNYERAKIADSPDQGEMPASVRRRVGPTITNLIRDFGSIYDSWMVDRIERHGGPVAAEAAEALRAIIDREKQFYGELTPSLDKARQLAGANRRVPVLGNVPSISGVKALSWLNQLDPIKGAPFAAIARTVGAIERTIRVPAFAQAVVDAARQANLDIGLMMQMVIAGFRAGNLFERNVTPLGFDVIRQGAGDMWMKWTAALARANKLPISQVRKFFTEWKRVMDSPESDAAAIESVKQDFARKFKNAVTHIKQDGRWQAVLHADLFNYLENAARRATHARAFRAVWPHTSVGRQDLAEVMADLRKELAPAYQKDLNALILTMQGHPTDNYSGMGGFAPTEPMGRTIKLFNQTIGNLFARMALTGQMFVQPGEVIAGSTPMFLGYKNYIKGMAQLKQVYPELEKAGMVNRVIHDFSYDPKSPVRSAFKIAGNTLSKGFAEQALNELQEAGAAATARVVADNIASDNLSDWEKRMLPRTFEAMGFNQDEVMGLMQGDPTLLGQFQRKAAAFLTSGNRAISEGSRLGANRLFNSVFRFQSYPMMKLNQLRRVTGALAEAWQEGTPYQKRTATEQFARFMFGNAAQGALTVAITSLAFGGLKGLEIKWEEAKDEPLEFLVESFLATMAGPMYIVWRGMNAKGILGVGENATRAAFPYTVLTDMIDFAQGAGKYRNLSTFDKIGKFVSAKMPGTKAITTGMALFGLGLNDQKLDASIDGFYRWRREELGFSEHRSFGTEDTRKEFRTKMRRAVEAMKDGDEEKFYEAYQEAADELLTMEKGTTMAEAFGNAKILKGATGADLTDEQKDSLIERIGEDAYNRLEYFDLMLEEAGKGVLLPKFDE